MSNDVELSEIEGDVEGLQARLADRESLVTELTNRLEQAAEQLDRLQRSGAGRKHVVGGGIPPELIEEQRALSEELQSAVQQWVEMQPTTLLARLEIQVGEVRDLIVERLDGSALAAFAATDQSAIAARSAEAASAPVNPETPDEGLTAYEAFKAGLAESEPAEEPQEEEADSADAVAEAAEPAAVVIPDVDPPAPVDFDDAGLEELREACDQRDSYITYLSSRVRVAESNTRPAGNWSDLETVPDELRERLEEHEKSLEESLRMHEVTTSMERARLGRESNRLELLEHQLRRRAAKLGVEVDRDDDEDGPEVETADEESPKKRGWFGFGKKSDD